MNAGKDELRWSQVEADAGSAEYITAVDTARFYTVLQFKDPAGLYGHEVGWRLVLHTITQDGRRIYYGETRAMCVQTAQDIHDGTFTGTLYGPTTIDQLDPSRSRRTCFEYDDGFVIDEYVMTSQTPLGGSQDISLAIHDYERLREILEMLIDKASKADQQYPADVHVLLSKIEQIVTRHYAGKPRPERVRNADLWDDEGGDENAGAQ